MRFTAAAALLATTAMAKVSTDYTTELITITSCAPEVTDCPAHSTKVSTNWVPLTTSTVYTTKVHTVTSCGAEVTKCPAHSTVITTETVPVSTTVCPVTETKTPVVTTSAGNWHNTTAWAPQTSSHPGNNGGQESSSSSPSEEATTGQVAPTTSVCKPSWSSTVVTKTYTTVLTAVETSSVEVPCPTTTAPGSAGPTGGAGNGGNGGDQGCPGGANCPSGNATTTQPPVTAGAASFAGSAVFAAVAGVAAYVLA